MTQQATMERAPAVSRAPRPEQHARQRKPARDLQWRIPADGGEPVWSDAAELRAALERTLDTDDKRIAASRLVLGWQMLRATGTEHTSRAGVAAVVQAKSSRSGIQRLITLAAELKAQAAIVADQIEDPETRALCAALVVHSQRDVARIRNQLLWAVERNPAWVEG